MIDDSNDETDLSHKLFLTDKQISRFRKAYANNSSANINLPKLNCLE